MAVLKRPPFETQAVLGLPQARPSALCRFALGLAGGCLLALVVILCLPHDPSIRWSLLRDTDYIKAGWIFDRLNNSQTPVDVALIGTSHTLSGVDSVLLEQELSAGQTPPIHVVNLALPHLGDDLHFLISHMLLKTKKPRLLIIETHQVNARAAHPAFGRLADVDNIVIAPFGNPDSLDMLAQIPRRQFRYFINGLWNAPTALPIADHWDDTYQLTLHDGRLTPPRLSSPAPAILLRDAARERLTLDQKALLYQKWGWLLWHYSDSYLLRMINEARDDGVRTFFLYLPVFGTDVPPAATNLMERYGKILTPPAELMNDPSLWFDKEHLNHAGSQRLTSWLARALPVLR